MKMTSVANLPHQDVVPGQSRFRQRVWLLVGVAAYVALFEWMYEYYLYPNWDYYGFHYNPPSWLYLALAWVLSVTPGLWMPVELRRPSQLAYWVLYLTVFIPSMFVPLYMNLDTPEEISLLMITLYAGLAMIGSCYLLPLSGLRPPRVSLTLFWKAFAGALVALAVWLALASWHHIQFLSFNDIYDLRDLQSESSEGTLVNYAFMLLTGAFNPFLMACGLFFKRKWLWIAGVLGQLLVYGVGGTKGSILSIIFVLGFYALLKSGRQFFGLKVIFGTFALAAGLCLSYVAAGYEPVPLQLPWVALFVVLMRKLSVNGKRKGRVYEFFQTHS